MPQPISFSKVFPIYKVEQDCILSKQGDVTLAFEVTLPEIFTLSDQEYEAFHQVLIKAIKVLPNHTVFHKQDWFLSRHHSPEYEGKEIPFLQDQVSGSGIAVLEIIRQGVIKVIKAVDLKIQRLQNKTIGLQNAQKIIENKLSELKLTGIAEWLERQRQLYKEYFDELWRVRNTIATYQRIKEILARQKRIIEDYRFTWRMIREDKHFTRDEIDYMYRVYTGILNQSVYNLDQILLVNAWLQLDFAERTRTIISKSGNTTQATVMIWMLL